MKTNSCFYDYEALTLDITLIFHFKSNGHLKIHLGWAHHYDVVV